MISQCKTVLLAAYITQGYSFLEVGCTVQVCKNNHCNSVRVTPKTIDDDHSNNNTQSTINYNYLNMSKTTLEATRTTIRSRIRVDLIYRLKQYKLKGIISCTKS